MAQQNVSKSLGTAGICALLLACDELKLFGSRIKDPDGIPKAFERIDNIVRNKNDPKPTINKDTVNGAISGPLDYQEISTSAAEWYYYWRYGQERYESLRDCRRKAGEESTLVQPRR